MDRDAARLGLADFERIALERNPTLKQAAAQFEAALHRSRQAGLYPNPVVGYVQDQIGSFSESMPTSGGFRGPRQAVAGRQRRGVHSVAARDGGQAAAEPGQVCRGGDGRALAGHRPGASRAQRRAHPVLRSAGRRAVDRASTARSSSWMTTPCARSRRCSTSVRPASPRSSRPGCKSGGRRSRFKKAENRFRGDWEELVSLVGAPGAQAGAARREAARGRGGAAELSTERLTSCLHHSPEIQAALSEIRRDEIMVRRERVEPIPNVQVQAVTGYNYEFGVQTAGVQIGIALPIFNRNQGTIREAMSDLSRDHAEYERVALSLRKRLAEVYTHYQDAAQSVEDFRAGSLPLARRAYELQVASYHQRRTPWAQVLASRRMYFDLSKDYVESLLELRRAEVEIGGMLLVDGLSSPPLADVARPHRSGGDAALAP